MALAKAAHLHANGTHVAAIRGLMAAICDERRPSAKYRVPNPSGDHFRHAK